MAMLQQRQQSRNVECGIGGNTGDRYISTRRGAEFFELMKNSKASGEDRITEEMLKVG